MPSVLMLLCIYLIEQVLDHRIFRTSARGHPDILPRYSHTFSRKRALLYFTLFLYVTFSDANGPARGHGPPGRVTILS